MDYLGIDSLLGGATDDMSSLIGGAEGDNPESSWMTILKDWRVWAVIGILVILIILSLNWKTEVTVAVDQVNQMDQNPESTTSQSATPKRAKNKNRKRKNKRDASNEPTTPFPGCSNPAALNYNPEANTDPPPDSPCTFMRPVASCFKARHDVDGRGHSIALTTYNPGWTNDVREMDDDVVEYIRNIIGPSNAVFDLVTGQCVNVTLTLGSTLECDTPLPSSFRIPMVMPSCADITNMYHQPAVFSKDSIFGEENGKLVVQKKRTEERMVQDIPHIGDNNMCSMIFSDPQTKDRWQNQQFTFRSTLRPSMEQTVTTVDGGDRTVRILEDWIFDDGEMIEIIAFPGGPTLPPPIPFPAPPI
jgi:hypothetical protein